MNDVAGSPEEDGLHVIVTLVPFTLTWIDGTPGADAAVAMLPSMGLALLTNRSREPRPDVNSDRVVGDGDMRSARAAAAATRARAASRESGGPESANTRGGAVAVARCKGVGSGNANVALGSPPGLRRETAATAPPDTADEPGGGPTCVPDDMTDEGDVNCAGPDPPQLDRKAETRKKERTMGRN